MQTWPFFFRLNHIATSSSFPFCTTRIRLLLRSCKQEQMSRGDIHAAKVSFNRFPFEDSRSRSTHLPDSDSIETCLEEMPETLIGRLFPRTTRPIRTLDPGSKSRVSPSRGPWSIISLRAKGSIFSEKERRESF